MKNRFTLPIPLYAATRVVCKASPSIKSEALTIKRSSPILGDCFTWNIFYAPSLPASFAQVVAFEDDGITTLEITDLDLRHEDAKKAVTDVVTALEALEILLAP